VSREDQRSTAASEVDRAERALADELERLFDRQEAVVLARLQGTKARKHTRHWEPAGDRPLEVKGILDPARWVKDAIGALTPSVTRLFGRTYARVRAQLAAGKDDTGEEPDLASAVTERLDLIGKGVETAAAEVEDYIAREEEAGTALPDIVAGVKELYADRKPKWAARIATISAVGSINHASLLAAMDAKSSAKQWLSRRDPLVRDTHEAADGQVRLLDERFKLGGIPTHPRRSLLMFPGDPGPSVPLDEIMNCRCTMLFSPPRPASKDLLGDDPLEVKAKVRTPAGAQHYGQPIGTTIVRSPDIRSPEAHELNKIAGGTVHLAGDDPAVRAAIAKHMGLAAPDPATTQVLVMRDRKDRVAGYVVWQTADGPSPKGTVVAVSVHPSLRGQGVGDKLVAAAATIDPNVVVTTRPGRGLSASTPTPIGPPVVRSRAGAGDQPGTSGDFDADAARIDRLQKAYMRDGAGTEALFGRGGRWSRSREAQQQAVIDHFLTKPGVKSDHQILVLGGLPGAGKTTSINDPAVQAAIGIDLSAYVTVNADEVKAQMIASGMVPDYPGLSPDEAATLFHDESFQIAHSLMRQAAKRKLNFAYDTSLKSTGQLGFTQSAGSHTMPPPWQTTLVFVDVPTAVAKQRARDRYLAGDRYMPLGLIDRMGSGPRRNFDAVKGSVDRWVLIDNAGASPQLVGQGAKKGRTAAPARPTPPVAAPAAPAPVSAIPAAPSPIPDTPAAAAAPTAITVPSALPPVPAGARVFAHPQGKHIYLSPDGSMQVYKPDGKRATSSATPQKLLAGYGGWVELGDGSGVTSAAQVAAPTPTASSAPALVAAPKAPLQVSAGAPAPAGSMPVAPMDFNELDDLSKVADYIADPAYVFQQKVDGIRGVLVIEPGKKPWFAGKKGDRLVSSTAAAVTQPMLAKLPATPAGAPAYRVEGEVLNGKFHVFDMVIVGQESTPYEQRKVMADAWVDAVSPLVPQATKLPTATTTAGKQALWDAVLRSGAEGVMMKRADSPYNGGARVNHTLKAKVTSTADVVVLSRNVGGKDNAEFGLRVGGKIVSIGNVSTGGKDKALGQINVGDVVEVEYLWASAGSNKLTQPRIIRKRPDKTINDVTEESQLRFVDKAVLPIAVKAAMLRLERARELVL
jgi:GNAT superfamily N-acetyltransferase